MAPQFLLLGTYMPSLPLVLFGCLSLTGAGLAMLLPETRGKSLPQDFEEAMANIEKKYHETFNKYRRIHAMHMYK